MKLSTKIIALVLTVLAVILTVSGWISVQREREILKWFLQRRGNTITQAVATNCIESLIAEEYPYIDTLIENTVREKDDVLWLEVVQNDKVVSRFSSTEISSEQPVTFEADVHFRIDETRPPMRLGQVRLGLSDRDNKKLIAARVRELIFHTTAIFAVLSITLMLVLRKLVLAKVRRLSGHARVIGEGNLEARLELGTRDELGSLARTLNEMSEKILVSHRKIQEQNEELRKLDKLKDDFLSNTTHELKTPLNGILGLVTSLLDGRYGQIQESVIHPLSLVRRSGDRLLDMVEKLLHFNRLAKAGTVENQRISSEEVSLSDVVEEVSAALQYQCQEKGIELITRVEPGHVIRAERANVHAILQNLMANAVKFTHYGSVTVGSQPIREKDDVLGYKVVVADTGVGIPEEVQEKVFERFFQGFQSESRPAEGVGIGLSIVKMGIQEMGGEITLRSQVDKGSTFTLLMPVHPHIGCERLRRNAPVDEISGSSPAPPPRVPLSTAAEGILPAPSESAPEKPLGDRKVVLVVDDDAINLEVLRSKLAQSFEVVAASSGRECLRIIQERPVHLILLDLMMPGMSGYDVLERLPESPYIPVICVSAKNQVSSIKRALTLGAVDYVTKPFREEELLVRINTHLKLKDALLQAQESSRLKSEFLANMSHEIRTPLNGVIGMVELLKETLLSDEQKELLGIVESSGETLLGVINDILDFSKIEAGKLSLEEIPFDLLLEIERVADQMAVRADERALDFVVRYAPGTPRRVIGDPGRLRQVLGNLVSNAIKFTEKGHVLVSVEGEPDGKGNAILRIAVEDSGIGIPENRLDQMFEKFTQVDSSTTRKYGGTGLGLAICKQLTRLMGGRIGVNSKVGQGSTFWFTLNLSLQAGEEPKPAAAEVLSGLRIAVVDENANNLKALDEQLRHLGMRSDGFGSSAEALKAVREARSAGDPYRLIILSDHLPTIGGRTLAGSFRRDPALRDAVLILMHPVSQRGRSKRFSQAGFSGFLPKPVRLSQLADDLVAAWNARRGAAAGAAAAYLPEEPPPAPVEERLESGPAAARPRVLLVEDNIVNQKVAVRMLGRLGCDVEVADNGREALDRLARSAFDIVFMDCQMPEMDGYEATAEIRRQEGAGSRIPIIAMTAHAMQGDRERCLSTGMSDYISKPVDMDELKALLDRWLPKREETTASQAPPAIEKG